MAFRRAAIRTAAVCSNVHEPANLSRHHLACVVRRGQGGGGRYAGKSGEEEEEEKTEKETREAERGAGGRTNAPPEYLESRNHGNWQVNS